ncbi:MAG: class I SAM-dependent methyltransferase [Bacillota bacterium]|nr:class I SAM-dependent methyltransferase [Bacillota bacterium]
MNQLTDRLQLIADMICEGETMADVGTDHGFLPLYLISKGICPYVVMTDVSEPSLNKAVTAAEEYGIHNGTSFRHGDGLNVLEAGEVDDVVIAGMGGILISQIMGEDLPKSMSYRKFILQPRNNAGYLRHWLCAHGFDIKKNALVREGKFICEIILAIPGKDRDTLNLSLADAIASEDDPSWEMPANMREGDPGLCAEYAGLKIRQERDILRGLEMSKAPDACRIDHSKEKIDYFRRFLDDEV